MGQETELDEQGLEVLSEQECRRRLEEAPVGRIAFVHERKPLVLPVNYGIYDEDIVFRTAQGSKLDAARHHPGLPVAFEIDDYDAGRRTGWSVVVQGQLDHVVDRSLIAKLESLKLQPWAEVAERDHWLRIVVERVTGRRILPLSPEARR